MNVSKQFSVTDDTLSMYLSFDDTMCESYKSPINCASIAIEDVSEKEDSKGNTTLEPQKDDDFELSELTEALAPLRLQPKLLHEFKSSTPSKIDDNKHSEHVIGLTGGESQRKANLSCVFENLITQFEENLKNDKETDKENKPISSTDDDSMPSFSSTTILKLQNENAKNSAPNRVKKHRSKTGKTISYSIEKSSSHNLGNKKVKMHTVVRKSLCEPNRIVKESSPYSYLETGDAVNAANCEWAIFDNFGDGKYLGTIDEHALPLSREGAGGEDLANVESTNLCESSRKSMKTKKAANIARRSFMPNIPGEIGGSRMPNVVKTTLSSTTRKAPRKSYASGATNNALASKRRSYVVLNNKLSSPLPKLSQRRYSRSSNVSSSDVSIPKSRAAGGNVVPEKRSSTNVSAATGRKTMYNVKPESMFTCPDCGAFFNVKSLLDAHKHTHKRVASPDAQRALASSNCAYNYQCKYCDKGFAIERALHIHLLEYCPKIPASERRKLDFKEMDHVAKAATPHFNFGPSMSQKKQDKDPLMNFPFRKIQNYRDGLSKNRVGDEIAKKDVLSPSTSEQISEVSSQMAPPSTKKVKKKTVHAHGGVHRTPNKDIPCLSCKQSFRSVIDYTNHMMSEHQSISSSKNQS